MPAGWRAGTDRVGVLLLNLVVAMAQKIFRNDRSHRCERFYRKIIQIGAILAIFRPFKVFAECLTVALTVALAPMWLEFGGGPASM